MLRNTGFDLYSSAFHVEYIQRTSEHLDPLAHAQQPKGFFAPVIGRWQAAPVILHNQQYIIICFKQAYDDMAGAGMARHIGQSFLNQAEQRRCNLIVQIKVDIAHKEIATYA